MSSTPPHTPAPRRGSAAGTRLACGLAAVIATAALGTILDPWPTDWRVPFGYRGDAILYQGPIKSMLEGGSHWTNPRLAAPDGGNIYDHPMPEGFHFLFLWACGKLSGNDWAVAYNLFIVVQFPAAAVSGCWVLRRFGAGVPAAVLGGVLFAYLPHHAMVMISQHVFLGAYFPIPLAVWLVVRVYEGELRWLARDQATGRVRAPYLSGRGWGAVAVCALMGSTGGYYAVFTCMFLLFAGVAGVVRGWKLKAGLPAAVCIALVCGSLAANLAPALAYHRQHGGNDALRRYEFEGNYWALRPAELVLPSTLHREPRLAAVSAKYDKVFSFTANAECATYVRLGVIPSLGLLAALLALFRKDGPGEGHQPAFTRLTVAALIVAGPGGFGPLFNFALTTWIRCYHRLCVFIGFCALATLVRLFDKAFPPTSGGWRKWAGVAVAAGLIALGLCDQTPRPEYPSTAAVAAEFAADREFVRGVESSLPPAAAVFQLPYFTFPETVPPGEMIDYDPMRGYLHSDRLRWSYGAMKGRPTADWQERVSKLPTGEFVTAITDAGFSAVWVDRYGYPDRRPWVEAELAPLADGPPLVSPTGRYAVYTFVKKK